VIVKGNVLGKAVEINLKKVPGGLVSWESRFVDGERIAGGVTSGYEDLFDPELLSEVKEMTGYSMMFD
jgi:hypothetical protein